MGHPDEKKAVLLRSGGMELSMNSACVNTVSHGSFRIEKFCTEGTDTRGETKEIFLSLQKNICDDIVLFRVRSEFYFPEDQSGEPFAMPSDHALEMELAVSGSEAENGEVTLLAIHQHKPWWMRPCFPKNLNTVPSRTQMVIGREKTTKRFFVLMALCSDHTRADLCGTEKGIRVTLSSNMVNAARLDELAFAFAKGSDPYLLIDHIYDVLQKNGPQRFRKREEKDFPPLFRKLGWCTWDSLGHHVSEAEIFRKMEEFREKQIPVKWVLIDDGWSRVDPERKTLKGFCADPVKFPKGLAHTTAYLKAEYGVEAVGVWQAFKGYWCGIAEDFEDWQKVSPYLCRYGNGEISVKPDPASSFGFWDAWHSMLENDGIDFVKIDGQSSMQLLQRGMATYGEGLRALYKGMEASVFLHFGGKVMNCMGMAPESVMSRSVTAFSRTSDDYLPTCAGSFYEHAMQNAYNNVYQGALYYGDWDMFWTEHEDAYRSAVLRLISGGPVYISDGYGHTDPDIIRMAACSDGKLRVCDDIGRPALDCLTKDSFVKNEKGEGGILKIYNRRESAVVIACFCGEKDAGSRIELSDYPCIQKERCMVYNTGTGEMKICTDSQPYEFSMKARETLVLELRPSE